MHNCKVTRSRLIEQALDETLSSEGALLAELERCPACREEFASLRSILRVADQGLQGALPEEGFWSDYHERLRQRLESASVPAVNSGHIPPRPEAGLQDWVRRLVTASLPVPVPLAAVLVVLVGLSLVYAMNSRRSSNRTGSPSVVTRTVEVPVIQERTVTRVVYRDRSAARGRASRSEPSSAVAARRDVASAGTPGSLVGFKPASEVKLTIIKGSYRDEK